MEAAAKDTEQLLKIRDRLLFALTTHAFCLL